MSSNPPLSSDQALVILGEFLRDAGYHFVTPTPETHRRVNSRPEARQARRVEDVFGWSRPFARDLLPAHVLTLMDRAGILISCPEGLRSTLRLSSLDNLLLFHSAYPTGDAASVFFGPDSYRFTAALRSHLRLLDNKPAYAADIGTGTGAGAFIIAQHLPHGLIVGSDINPAALRLAEVNRILNGQGNVTFRESNLLQAVDGFFDLIVANPPYLADPARRTYRDGGGVLGSALSLAFIDGAIARLAPGGSLLLYTGSAIVGGRDRLRAEAGLRLERAGFRWHWRELDPDVFGEELDHPAYDRVERIAAVLLSAFKPG